jgi:LCP family protein required for cell wall assembly
MSGRYVKLSEVYGRYGLDILLNKVYAMTGMTIDNYALVSMEAFPAIIDTLGGINYNVPCDMKYVDNAGGINIDIKKGAHRLDGKGVLDVLMFKNYTDGGSREKTTADLIRKFISTFISITNYNRAPAVFAELEAHVDTNFTLDKFKNNIDIIFKYAPNNREVSAITRLQKVGKDELFIIDETATCDIFVSYKRIYN